MNEPFFSVIIPTRDRFALACRAIDSVLSQSYRDYEIIVVDDGSSDDTPSLQRIYKNSIHYLRQECRGVSSARNRGIQTSSGRYIALLDSDDEWLPNKLSAQQEFIMQNPGIRIHQTDEIWIRRGTRVNPMNKHQKKSGDIFMDSLPLCIVSPSAVAMSRDIFEEYGYFDEAMPVCEDYDLWLRISVFEKFGLIRKGLILKYGGHSDQLSKKYWGMDRFRVYSILKLLDKSGHTLSEEQLDASIQAVIEKCEILRTGAKKRDNFVLLDIIERILVSVRAGQYSSRDYPSLLEI